MKLSILCSTPNFRGIHQYSLYIFRLVKTEFATSYLTPASTVRKHFKLLGFFHQVLWELFPAKSFERVDLEIYSTPRLPFRVCLPKRTHPLRALVIHDFIQYIDFLSPKNLISTLFRVGLLEFMKRILHSVHTNFGLRHADLILFNSSYTRELSLSYLPNHHSLLTSRSLVLHPAPSFTKESIHHALQSIPARINPQSVAIHVVTGSSPSKNTALLEACFSVLKIKASQQGLNFTINIFGYSSDHLNSLSCPFFIVRCNPKSVPETQLIHSYLLSDVFITTSLQEGFGIPLMDSILFDLSCIATPIESFLEISSYYHPLSNSLVFARSSDSSAANELADLVIKSSSSFTHRTPQQKALSYIEASDSLFCSAQQSLLDFLKTNNPSVVR